MNERLEHADLAYTAWVECGVALGGNDRLGDMVVREISAWALGGSDRHFAWVYSTVADCPSVLFWSIWKSAGKIPILKKTKNSDGRGVWKPGKSFCTKQGLLQSVSA